MKKFTLLFIALLCIVMGFSQTPRLVLHEEFTSSTCGPCVAANNKFKPWLTTYSNIYTAIFWHVNWPSPGNDPMYAANPVDNGSRVSYYSVNSVPYAVVDGNYWTGNGQSLAISTIQNRSNDPSPFAISLQKRNSPTNDSIYLTMLISATQAVSASMVAHNVVIEKNIHFNIAPGTNGEKDFPNVMKKMLPSKDGTTLPSSYAVGDYTIIETSWAYANVYDTTQVAAISFVQNKTTKEVYQAANSVTTPITLPYDNDLQVIKVSNVSATNCSGKVTPVIQVRNNGNDAVTSFEVKYSINGGPVSTYNWSGNITSLEKAVITLPEMNFTPIANNTLQVFSNNPNLAADQYPKNDTLNIPIAMGPPTKDYALMILRTDGAPEEVTWDVKNSSGVVVQSHGPYATPNHTYLDTIHLPAVDCYVFTIYDAGGNGICCTNGSGIYQITDDEQHIIHQGSNFGASDFAEFKDDPESAIEKHEQYALNVYPNPFNGPANITFYLRTANQVTFTIYDLFGKKVKSFDGGYFTSGNHETVVDASGIAPGVYMLQLQSGSQVHSKKIAVK